MAAAIYWMTEVDVVTIDCVVNTPYYYAKPSCLSAYSLTGPAALALVATTLTLLALIGLLIGCLYLRDKHQEDLVLAAGIVILVGFVAGILDPTGNLLIALLVLAGLILLLYSLHGISESLDNPFRDIDREDPPRGNPLGGAASAAPPSDSLPLVPSLPEKKLLDSPGAPIPAPTGRTAGPLPSRTTQQKLMGFRREVIVFRSARESGGNPSLDPLLSLASEIRSEGSPSVGAEVDALLLGLAPDMDPNRPAIGSPSSPAP